MGKGFAKRKKQAKIMQDQFSQMQEQIDNLEATGSSGNGLVTITLSGEYAIKKMMIKPECVDVDDLEGLEDLIVAAHNDALKNLQDKMPTPPHIEGMPDLGAFGF